MTGFVADADTGAPVAGATIQVQGTSIAVTTAADGSYTVGPLNPGRSFDLLASADGYLFTVTRIVSINGTFQGPQVLLTRSRTPVTITNSTGGAVISNATPGGSAARVDLPPNALPGGVTVASVGVTLILGAAVPGAPADNTKVIYPAVDVSLLGASGSFAQPVKLTFPLPFSLTAGTRLPVLRLEIDGRLAPTDLEATVEAGGRSAACNLTEAGTYGLALSLQVAATPAGSDRIRIPGPYQDPVVVPVSRAAIAWIGQSADTRAALTSAFVQGQRRGLIAFPGNLDATALVIHPRGTSPIDVVTSRLTLTAAAPGFSATGTVEGLAHHEIRAQ